MRAQSRQVIKLLKVQPEGVHGSQSIAADCRVGCSDGFQGASRLHAGTKSR